MLSQPGWRVVGEDAGCVVVERDTLRIWAQPDEVDDVGGETVRVRLPADLPFVDPGFHCVRGITPASDAGGSLDRFYWHLRPDGAAAFVRMVNERLNSARVPFFLKVLADPTAFGRADAGVLLVARRDRAALLPAVQAIYARLASQLDPPTPAFTKSLAPGLGFAARPRRRHEFRHEPVVDRC